MISFKNKKAGRVWLKKLPRSLRNLQEMCLYISGCTALAETLRFGCMHYRQKRGYAVLLESNETFEFCVLSMKIPKR